MWNRRFRFVVKFCKKEASIIVFQVMFRKVGRIEFAVVSLRLLFMVRWLKWIIYGDGVDILGFLGFYYWRVWSLDLSAEERSKVAGDLCICCRVQI
jgi:hypothetical protein